MVSGIMIKILCDSEGMSNFQYAILKNGYFRLEN